MNEYTQQIRDIAKQLLKEKKVDAVIGYQQASLGHMSQPVIARDANVADTLIFNCNCRMNLTNYLGNIKGKTAIVVKGCDSRNLVTHIVENRVKRDDLYIIGVPCSGLADKNRLMNVSQGTILSVEDQGDIIKINSPDQNLSVDRKDVLQENCKTCIRRNPVIYDCIAGPQVPELEITNRFADVEHIEAMETDQKQAFFDGLLENCIRCYACRDACPLCYCPTCFVDESHPQWVGRTLDPVDVKTYHQLRAFHDAGRCTDCGACEAACPMDIKIRYFTRKGIKDCVERFHMETGLNEGQRPALDQFSLNDPEEFIR